MWFGVGWIGTDMNEMMERNAAIMKAQKEALELSKKAKCEICKSTDTELTLFGFSLPYYACSDVPACDVRWEKLLPITN